MPLNRRTGGRSERVQKAVFTAALALYCPGETVPSMATVAAKAGVQKTTLYRRWSSPEALMHEAVAHGPRQAIPVPDTGSLRGDLRELARLGHEFVVSDEGRGTTRMLVAAEEASRRAYWTQRYDALSPIFKRAVARGELAADAKWELYLDAIVGSSVFAAWVKGTPLSLEATLAIVELLCR